jgi:hypothetical protein
MRPINEVSAALALSGLDPLRGSEAEDEENEEDEDVHDNEH